MSNQQLSTLQWRIPLPRPLCIVAFATTRTASLPSWPVPSLDSKALSTSFWLHRETERKATPRKETLKFGHLSNPTSPGSSYDPLRFPASWTLRGRRLHKAELAATHTCEVLGIVRQPVPPQCASVLDEYTRREVATAPCLLQHCCCDD